MLRQKSVLIVIPTFNRALQLERAIKSVLTQTHRDFTLVVVDDASTENLSECRQIVENAGHIWKRLEQNSGPAAARNEGTRDRKFDWVTFLDSDDTWLPEKLERQLNWFSQNPQYRINQVRDRWIRNGIPFSKPTHLEPPTGRILHDCIDRCAVGPSCVMIRSDLWKETGGFDPFFRVCEDYELWLRIAHKEKIGLVDTPVLAEKHGGHPDQLSTSVPALDRYRLVALALFYQQSPDLSDPDLTYLKNAFAGKCKILASGAAKRNRPEWERFFRNLTLPLSPADLQKAKKYCTASPEGT